MSNTTDELRTSLILAIRQNIVGNNLTVESTIAANAILPMFTQAKKDLLAEVREKMPESAPISPNMAESREIDEANCESYGFNTCRTQALAAIKEIEEKL